MAMQTTTTRQLSDRHYAHCVTERGLDPRWVEANCRSADIPTASARLGYAAKSTGILLEGVGIQIQFRPDKPWKSHDEKKAPKYRSPLGDFDAILPKHPDIPDYWDNTEALKERCWHVDGHPCIVATEGVFTAIAPCAEGVPTVALLGVEMGLTSAKNDPQGKRYLVPELERLAKAGFGFILGFDADCADNERVSWAQLKLAHQLKRFGVPIYNITGLWAVEQGKGMDDYIKNHGGDAFKRDILGKAQAIEKWEAQFKDSDQPKSDKPNNAQIAAKIAEDYRPRWAFDDERQTWRIWNGKYWESIRDSAFDSRILQAMKAAAIPYKSDSQIADSQRLVKRELRIESWNSWDKKSFINAENGIFDIEGNCLIAHAPGARFVNAIKHNIRTCDLSGYTSAVAALAALCPATYQFFSQAMRDDNRKILKLLAIVNGIIKWRWGQDLQQFVHLIGAPGTGKGTFVRLLEKIVGSDNFAPIKGKQLDDGSHIARIVEKQLVVLPDQRRQDTPIDWILNLTGNDKISYRDVYKSSASAYFEGCLVVVSNNPIFSGDITGIKRRLCLVDFDNPVPAQKRSSKFEAIMADEIENLIPIALSISDERVTELIRGLGEGEIQDFRLKEWQDKQATDNVAAWMEERIVHDPNFAYTLVGSNERAGSLYTDYVAWCDRQGIQKSYWRSTTTFRPQLQQNLSEYFDWPDVEWRARLTSGADKGLPAFTCLRLRRDGDEAPLLSELFGPIAYSCSEDPGEDFGEDSGEDFKAALGADSEGLTVEAEKVSIKIFNAESTSNQIPTPTNSETNPQPFTIQAEQGFEAESQPFTQPFTEVVSEVVSATEPPSAPTSEPQTEAENNPSPKITLAEANLLLCIAQHLLPSIEARAQMYDQVGNLAGGLEVDRNFWFAFCHCIELPVQLGDVKTAEWREFPHYDPNASTETKRNAAMRIRNALIKANSFEALAKAIYQIGNNKAALAWISENCLGLSEREAIWGMVRIWLEGKLAPQLDLGF